MKKLILMFVFILVSISCEKELRIEKDLCDCPRTEFRGELYVMESLGSNCLYDYSYKCVISMSYNSSREVILLSNKLYEEKSFVFKIGTEDEKIIEL